MELLGHRLPNDRARGRVALETLGRNGLRRESWCNFSCPCGALGSTAKEKRKDRRRLQASLGGAFQNSYSIKSILPGRKKQLHLPGLALYSSRFSGSGTTEDRWAPPSCTEHVVYAQGETRVAIAVQVVSSHPLLTRAVEKILARAKDFRIDVLPPALNEAEAISQSNSPRLFLLDGCSLRTDLGRLAERCRATSPGSKFLALLSPENGSHAEKTRLFYWGIDGFVELHKTWQTELPLAIRAVLGGQPWVPPEILVAFVKQAKMLLDAQLLPGHSLTAREGQVLQLLMRRLTNKEISSALSISERTVKFHVSNILSKLQLEDRRGLLSDKPALGAFASEA